jgi:hypothetical protein
LATCAGGAAKHLRLPPQLPHVPRVEADEVALAVGAGASYGVHDSAGEFKNARGLRLAAEGKRGFFDGGRGGFPGCSGALNIALVGSKHPRLWRAALQLSGTFAL